MSINYDHAANIHSPVGPKEALRVLFGDAPPKSILDLGCGMGMWTSAAIELGVPDAIGVDGVHIDASRLLIPRTSFRMHNLTEKLDLGRTFDLAICFEVAEHIDDRECDPLIDSLVAHSQSILFSAACPGQPGQHHVNCRWPEYWQSKFNQRGYACSDSARWKLWHNELVEVWYRQNMFSAKYAPDTAGSEARIPAVVHPEIIGALRSESRIKFEYERIRMGHLPLSWYLSIGSVGIWTKLKRRLGLTDYRAECAKLEQLDQFELK